MTHQATTLALPKSPDRTHKSAQKAYLEADRSVDNEGPQGQSISEFESSSNAPMQTHKSDTFGPSAPPSFTVSAMSECSLTSSQRLAQNARINRYWEKKACRSTQKKVRYDCRQNLAKQRFRH